MLEGDVGVEGEVEQTSPSPVSRFRYYGVWVNVCESNGSQAVDVDAFAQAYRNGVPRAILVCPV